MNLINVYSKYIKRLLDTCSALLVITIFIPVLVILYIIIKLEDSSSPFLFKQKRAGKGGESFNIIKIRTMRAETHKLGVKLTDGERLLKAGKIIRKLSLDEIPQTINIIKGEMSFIGPRPLPVRYLPYYTTKEFNRHNVLPGISGLAQVKGRNLVAWKKRFELDVYYVNNISFLLDIKILLLTIYKVFKRDKVVLKDYNPLQDLDQERRDMFESKSKYKTT